MGGAFSPLNSEVLVCIGAGATAALGMPQTAAQTDIFRKLGKDGPNLAEILGAYFEGKDLEVVTCFFHLLDGSAHDSGNLEVSPQDIAHAKRIFGQDKAESVLRSRILELRRDYDWNALKQILKICPHNEENDNLIRDAYSIIDKKILAGQSIKVRAGTAQEESLSVSRLQGARNFLTLFINMLFAAAWFKITQGKNEEQFERYRRFVNTFGCLMQKEGMELHRRNYPLDRREFYLFSTSFISFNFEMVFPWILMNCHHQLNHAGTYIASHPLKLWLDFGCEHRGRKRQGGQIVPTIEFTETVASRENEDRHIGTPLNRTGKFYFAHGSSHWRECPNCGRMTFFNGGNKWEYKEKSLIPPLPIPLFTKIDSAVLTEQEQKLREEKLHFDSLQCMHCGSETFAFSAPMIMQTLYKSTPTSFLEEIQRNVRVSLEKARHIILLGYQLPSDDVVWQQTFAEAVRSRLGTGEKAYCSVVVGFEGENKWLYKRDLENFIQAHESRKNAEFYGIPAIKNAIAIFGKDQVRAYTGGIPQVFGTADERAVKELLYPTWVSWKGTRLEHRSN